MYDTDQSSTEDGEMHEEIVQTSDSREHHINKFINRKGAVERVERFRNVGTWENRRWGNYSTIPEQTRPVSPEMYC
jgi:hypothetical protein